MSCFPCDCILDVRVFKPKPLWKTGELMMNGKISLVRGIHFYPYFYFFFPTSMYMLWRICSCTEWRLLMNYCERNIFTIIGSFAKCWLDIYHWSAIVAVTARLRGTGQNVLEFSLETGCSSNLTYVHILLLITFSSGSFNYKYNIIIMLFINYKLL